MAATGRDGVLHCIEISGDVALMMHHPGNSDFKCMIAAKKSVIARGGRFLMCT